MIPMYNTKKFNDIYPKVELFVEDYNNSPFPRDLGSTSIECLYYLLYARYGNNPIVNYDETQWKYRLLSIIFQYGPTWEKRLEIQSKLRNLSEDDVRQGFKQIMNTALNPDSEPNTNTLQELDYINSQNTSTGKKGVVGAYAELWDILKVDVTEDFIARFKKLFKLVVLPEQTYIYEGEE